MDTLGIMDTMDTYVTWENNSWIPFNYFANEMIRDHYYNDGDDDVFDYTTIISSFVDNDGIITCIYDGFLQTSNDDIIYIEAKKYQYTNSVKNANINFENFKNVLYGNHLYTDNCRKIFCLQSAILDHVIKDKNKNLNIKKYYFILEHNSDVIEKVKLYDWIPIVGEKCGYDRYRFKPICHHHL